MIHDDGQTTSSSPETRTGTTIETPPGDPFLGVRSAGVPLLVPAAEVREVVRARRPTRVPGATAPFRGLLGLRGEMVSVVDLADVPGVFDGDIEKWLKTTGMTTGGIRPDRLEAVLVLRGGRHPIGLQVGGVDQVRMIEVDLHGESGAPPPYDGACWSGTAHVGEAELGILDVAMVRRTLVQLVDEAAAARNALDRVKDEAGSGGRAKPVSKKPVTDSSGKGSDGRG